MQGGKVSFRTSMCLASPPGAPAWCAQDDQTTSLRLSPKAVIIRNWRHTSPSYVQPAPRLPIARTFVIPVYAVGRAETRTPRTGLPGRMVRCQENPHTTARQGRERRSANPFGPTVTLIFESGA
jgi:hypothetical protein